MGSFLQTCTVPFMTNRASNEVKEYIAREVRESAAVTSALSSFCSDQIVEASKLIIDRMGAGGKLLVFGNGGSATESQHFAAEMVGRYRRDRRPLAAVALTTDSVSLTAIGNDYGVDHVFSRQLEAIARPGDVVVAISTSGNSPNVLKAVESARSLSLPVVGLTGETGGELAGLVTICLKVPSDCVPRIQEAHKLIVHLLCGLVEDALFATHPSAAQIEPAAGKVR